MAKGAPGVWRSKSSTRTVRNGVLNIKRNLITGMGFRPVELEETIASERH